MRSSDPFQIDSGRYSSRRQARPVRRHVEPIDSTAEFGTSLQRLNEGRQSLSLAIIASCILMVLVGRMVQVQIVHGSTYRLRSDSNRVRSLAIPAPRGAILDRHGVLIAENVPNITLTIIPADIPKKADERQTLLQRIADETATPMETIETVLASTARRSTDPVILREQLSYEDAMRFIVAFSDVPAVSIVSVPNRRYPFGAQSSAILGYTGRISSEQLAKNPQADALDIVGKTGLEIVYNEQLTGQDGITEVERDVNNREQRILSQRDPVPGKTVVTSIDIELQRRLSDRLQDEVNSLKAPGGAAVALDPSTGEILALASAPRYDNNVFVTAGNNDAIRNYIQDTAKPLLNRVISGQYPSGSIVKPLISAAALAERVITSSTTVLSVGGFKVGNDFFPDWKAGGHGVTNVMKAIAESVNTFYYAVGGGYESITGLGVDRIVSYLQKFGWGSTTGIDLPAEADGFLPTKEWRTTKRASPWKLGDTYHLAIGQGDLEVTPMQIVAAIGSIANGGTLYVPHLVKEIRTSDGAVSDRIEPAVRTEKFLSDTVLQTVQAGMRQGVLSGSSRSMQSLPVSSAGKTGTAQFGNQGKTHAWYAAYAPYEQPKIVIVVLVEAGGEGNAAALPVAKDVLQWYFTEGAGKS
jgi:penicillin-binding protein 2